MITMTDLTTITTGLPLKSGRWSLDTAHARAGFAIRHLGVAKVRGHFADVDAELVVGSSLADSSVTATIGLASIDTGNADRDGHVRTAEFLDVDNNQTMTFRSSGIHGDGEDWKLEGELTIGDVTRPVSLDVELGGVADFFDGTRHAGFGATGQVRRKDFGLDFGAADLLLGDVVKFELDLEFIEPA